MLTIAAWVVFVPAFVWNIAFFLVAFKDIFVERTIDWFNIRNLKDAVISLMLLFIPGVYLFGWF